MCDNDSLTHIIFINCYLFVSSFEKPTHFNDLIFLQCSWLPLLFQYKNTNSNSSSWQYTNKNMVYCIKKQEDFAKRIKHYSQKFIHSQVHTVASIFIHHKKINLLNIIIIIDNIMKMLILFMLCYSYIGLLF